MIALICFLGMLFSLGFLLYADYYGMFYSILFWKTLSSILFVLTGYFSYRQLKRNYFSNYFKFIFAGLVFSLGGDFFLALDQNNGIFFVIGLISFSLAHISYIMAFFSVQKLEKLNIIWTILCSVPLILLVTFTSLFDFDGLYPLVLLYAVLISFMVGKSMSFWKYRTSFRPAVYMTILGACMFLVSDFILLFALFMINGPKTELQLANHFIYYIGQGILALSLSKLIPNN